MRTWIHERGRWVEAPYPFREELDDLGGELERLSFGSRHGSSASVRVYEAQEDIATVEAVEGPVDVEFLVSVNTPTRRYPVFVVDLPSLVQLMGELRPMLAGEPEKSDSRDR